jgi:hypothetical protein
MGAQYPIMSGAGLTGPTWYRLGTFNSTSGVRMLRLDLVMQSPVANFMQARLTFSTNNGALAQNTYDTPPVAFNAWADIQTTSVDWYYSTLGTDVVVQQLSNTSYAFFVRITPDNGVGFFTVYHSTGGDAFTFVGTNAGSTRPSNGVYPLVSQPLDPGMIGAASSNSPTITGTASLQNLTVSGTVSGTLACTDLTASSSLSVASGGFVAFPNNSVPIECISGLTSALAGKATLGGSASFTSLTASSFVSSGLFNSQAGSFSATNPNVFGNLLNVAGKRGLLFLDGQAPNTSSMLAYFSCITPNPCLSILARNGNAYSFANVGTAAGTGTVLINVGISDTSNLRVSANQNGTIFWAVVYF